MVTAANVRLSSGATATPACRGETRVFIGAHCAIRTQVFRWCLFCIENARAVSKLINSILPTVFAVCSVCVVDVDCHLVLKRQFENCRSILFVLDLDES